MNFLGIWLSTRNGYWLYGLKVRAPPQGFSHASFSSKTTVSSPAVANRSAAKAPAGPPPRTATRFIEIFQVSYRSRWADDLQAGRRCRPLDVRAAWSLASRRWNHPILPAAFLPSHVRRRLFSLQPTDRLGARGHMASSIPILAPCFPWPENGQ